MFVTQKSESSVNAALSHSKRFFATCYTPHGKRPTGAIFGATRGSENWERRLAAESSVNAALSHSKRFFASCYTPHGKRPTGAIFGATRGSANWERRLAAESSVNAALSLYNIVLCLHNYELRSLSFPPVQQSGGAKRHQRPRRRFRNGVAVNVHSDDIAISCEIQTKVIRKRLSVENSINNTFFE